MMIYLLFLGGGGGGWGGGGRGSVDKCIFNDVDLGKESRFTILFSPLFEYQLNLIPSYRIQMSD